MTLQKTLTLVGISAVLGLLGAAIWYINFYVVNNDEQTPRTTREVVQELVAAELGVAVAGVTVSGEFPEGFNFARGEYTLAGEGQGIFLAAEIGGEWRLAYAGEAPPPCEIIEPYGFPSAMMYDCVFTGEELSTPFEAGAR